MDYTQLREHCRIFTPAELKERAIANVTARKAREAKTIQLVTHERRVYVPGCIVSDAYADRTRGIYHTPSTILQTAEAALEDDRIVLHNDPNVNALLYDLIVVCGLLRRFGVAWRPSLTDADGRTPERTTAQDVLTRHGCVIDDVTVAVIDRALKGTLGSIVQ